MNVVETVAGFLRSNTSTNFCQACLHKQLGVKARSQIEYATLRLALSPDFGRKYATCSVCGRVRRVIWAS